MKFILKLLPLVFFGVIIYSCCEDDEEIAQPIPKDRGEQYLKDKDSIELALDRFYIDVNNDLVKIPSTGVPSGFTSLRNDSRLKEFYFKNDDLNFRNLPPTLIGDNVEAYKVYVFDLTGNLNFDNESNTVNTTYDNIAHVTDSVFVSYKGWRTRDGGVFNDFPEPVWFRLMQNPLVPESAVFSGFRQIMPLIKKATYIGTNSNGEASFSGGGSIIVLFPSGLAYFDQSSLDYRRFENLAFRIELKNIKRRDFDNDGIPNIFEYAHADFNNPILLQQNSNYIAGNSNRFNVLNLWNTNNNQFNTNNLSYVTTNNLPDFIDFDDDGDGVLTRREIRKRYGPDLRCGKPFWYNNNSLFNFYSEIEEENGNKVHLNQSKRFNYPNFVHVCP
jgi:FKBP-type peptidyl-prolyl cis-trans isomerase FkpA